MKTAILTFQDSLNFGAALQALALQKYVISLGYPCEVLNYSNSTRRERHSVGGLFRLALKKRDIKRAIRVVFGAPMIHKRIKVFKAFYREKVLLSAKRYTSTEALSADLDRYQCYIAGSDQIWNWRNNGGDASYLLDFVGTDKYSISYASSFGMAEIMPEIQNIYTKALNNISALSVRERKAAQIVAQLTGQQPEVVLDPTFLLDKDQWSENLTRASAKVEKPYVLVYASNYKMFEEFQRQIGVETEKYDVVVISTSPKLSSILKSKIKFSLDPFEFVRLIQDAAYVLTSSFHGTALSIILQKNFISFLSGDAGKDARILELLQATGLEHRIFSDGMDKNTAFSPVDYEPVSTLLEEKIEHSKRFLQNALKAASETKHKKTISICSRETCTGCGACRAVCPVHAIKMVKDKTGFLYPSIDGEICIGCQKCVNTCPSNKSGGAKQAPLHVYGFVHSDKETLMNSSSGGAFSALAQSVIDDGGVVFGAAFDDNLCVTHMPAETTEALKKFRGSKYVQSDLRDSMELIAQKLKEGKTVLFSGTPCQVAGVKAITGNPENLYTIDLICKGVPSPGIFANHVAAIEKEHEKRITAIRFRDKRRGKAGVTLVYDFEDGTSRDILLSLDTYGSAFFRDVIHRESCYSCPYAATERTGDVTLGDFWGFGRNIKTELKRENGVSLVLVNTKKGETLAAAFSRNGFFEQRTLQEAVAGNKRLTCCAQRPAKRDDFLRAYEKDERSIYRMTRKWRLLTFAQYLRRKTVLIIKGLKR